MSLRICSTFLSLGTENQVNKVTVQHFGGNVLQKAFYCVTDTCFIVLCLQ